MNTTKALRTAIESSQKSMRTVSADIGKSENYVSSVIGQAERMSAELTVSTVSAIGAACGYQLALVPAEDVPSTAIVID